jgi:tRNA (mo5U34)-methyltransferase
MDIKNQIRNRIGELSLWFHDIHLPNGIQTAPEHQLGDFPAVKWKDIAPHLPADLFGYRILDIGCNAGYYSIECARRGASVTAIDMDDHYLVQAKWVAGIFDLRDHIKFHQMQVYDHVKKDWSFDIAEYLSATGRQWLSTLQNKTGTKR